MDLEGYAKIALRRGVATEEIEQTLAERILEVRDIPRDAALRLSRAVVEEAERTLCDRELSGVTMGNFGVGSRGSGDFYVHEQIANVIGKTGAIVGPDQLDDSGVVRANGDLIVITVDGMHSRLSDFPFLAGFHVTRASLRDIYVMGARPVALFSDIHLADDGDISKVFDYTAGIGAVAEVMDVPLVTGSTLRVGGDMVIGDRLTGCVGAVGIASPQGLTARVNAREGDVIFLTEGAGGGTITAAALYNGYPEVVQETLNLKFLHACDKLVQAGLVTEIHAMTDVTNGGIRGDAEEISKTARVKIVLEEEKVRGLINPAVLRMLDDLQIDYMGVSVDSLLLVVPAELGPAIKSALKGIINVDEVGHIEPGSGAEVLRAGERFALTPKFRESAYTPVKKVVGEYADGREIKLMRAQVDLAAARAIDKKQQMIEYLRTGKKLPDVSC
ncbi:MAG: AIR synthase related protein [Halobacteriota archaeon]|jgi:hydrogenase expression/formation protein